MSYTLELLHIADQEAASAAVVDAPNLSAVLNALIAEDLGGDGEADNTILLSSGDAIIPGLFFDASEEVFGSQGIADIQIQNELGIQAIALGNHEFDLGPEFLASLISGEDADGNPIGDFSSLTTSDLAGATFGGAAFPYLSTNLDFSGDPSLAALEVEGGGAPQPNVVTSSTVLTETVEGNGTELIGVIGATTPSLPQSSSPGGVGVTPTLAGSVESEEEIAELAATIQAEVDALLAANPDMNKVVLLAHMQSLDIERALAAQLENVDVIVGGGSDTILADDTDRLRDGQEASGTYPEFIENAGGTTTALVNTDGQYQYVGRLVIDFDDDGNVIAESYDEDISGAYATDDQGVADLNAEELVDPEIQAIADAIGDQIVATESNVLGFSDVFLNGNRFGDGSELNADGVRTQETNLGNLTADANLAYAQNVDDTVVLSLKNGGGIRANIGETVVPAGETEAVRGPNGEVVDGDGNVIKPEGGISENDIRTTLAFNNDLTLLTLTKEELIGVLEHGVSALPDVDGAFPQVAGVNFTFDETQEPGSRIVDAVIVDDAGEIVSHLMVDGEMVGAADDTFRIVTLGFLAAPRFDEEGNFVGGGDGYPFPNTNTDPALGEVADAETLARIDPLSLLDAGLDEGTSNFAEAGSEQDALAEYLQANHGTQETAYSEADGGVGLDSRIVQLAQGGVDQISNTELEVTATTELFAGEGTPNPDDHEGYAEIVAIDGGMSYVTNGALDRIDAFDIETGELSTSFDLSFVDGYDGVQSVAAKNGVIAAAVATAGEGGAASDGVVVLFDSEGTVLTEVTVGNLPDALTFNDDGTMIAVANEGEPLDDSDPASGISLIDLSGGTENPTVTNIDFTAFDGMEDDLRAEGVRIFPGKSASEDLEPEYATFSPDGTTVFVSLQENNAIAVVDTATGEVTDIFSTGTQDLSDVAFDVNDDDEVYAPDFFENVVSMRMADTITAFETGGETYILTANEGDARDEDARVEDVLAGEAFYDLDGDGTEEEVRFDESFDATGLERLEISLIDGDTDGDGDIDVATAYGGRSFSIFSADGELVFDSGDDFGRIAAANNPNWDDGRSDNKGVEPEAITFGEIDDRVFAFIGLERDSGIMVYDVTDPENSEFVEYLPPEGNGISPEGMAFIPEGEDGESAQLAVSYELDGVTELYDLSVNQVVPDEPAPDTEEDDDDDDFFSDVLLPALTVLGAIGLLLSFGAG